MPSLLRIAGRRARSHTASLLVGLLASLALPLAAHAESVVERAARTGVITMGGRTDVPPYSFLNGKQELGGYAIDVASLIEAEVSRYLGKPVKVEFVPTEDPAKLFAQVSRGEVDLACGAQFTWEREMFVDFSIPFSLSGIRVLTRTGKLDGTPESLAGKRIAVVAGSLGEATIKALQPRAALVPLASLAEGIRELQGGRVDGVAGDSITLAASIKSKSATGFELVPAEGYARYAVGCIMPENNSTFRNLVDLAIARMIQGYVSGDPSSTALVNRWMGPQSVLGLPPELIRTYFQTVLLNHEQIRLAPDQPPSPSPQALPSAR